MELPISKPSRVSYADELEFSKLLEELARKKHNGFIRVTHGSEEGYILFSEGNQIAASYDHHMKTDAIDKIKSVMDKVDTLIEVFDLKTTQIGYLKDLNKVFLISEDSEVYNMIEELKGKKITPPSEPQKPEVVEEGSKLEAEVVESEPEVEPEHVVDIVEEKPEPEVVEEGPAPEPEAAATEPEAEPEPMVDVMEEKPEPEVVESEPELELEKSPEAKADDLETESEHEVVEDVSEVRTDDIEPEVTGKEPVSREELMRKYGLKDVNDEEVETILESYKGGSISHEDLERIELTLMNKIKKSIMGIPKIKGVEVMVFLDSARELTGTINIISEYGGTGFFSRIVGSNDKVKLENRIYTITEMEIKKSFREYPEIINNFEINIEIH